MNRLDGESNENVYRKFGMSSRREGMSCGVVEMVNRNTLRWFGHLERRYERELSKKIYKSKIDGGNVRGRPPIKWEDRVMEYVRERERERERGCRSERTGRCESEVHGQVQMETLLPWPPLLDWHTCRFVLPLPVPRSFLVLCQT